MLIKLSRKEVSKHNSERSCWVIYNRCVYDVTSYLSKHPGPRGIILKFAGKDITEVFNRIHVDVNINEILKGKVKGFVEN